MSKLRRGRQGRSISVDGSVSNLESRGETDNVNRDGPREEEQFWRGADREVISGKIPMTILPDDVYRLRATS